MGLGDRIVSFGYAIKDWQNHRYTKKRVPNFLESLSKNSGHFLSQVYSLLWTDSMLGKALKIKIVDSSHNNTHGIENQFALLRNLLEERMGKGPDGDIKRSMLRLVYPDGDSYYYDLNNIDSARYNPETDTFSMWMCGDDESAVEEHESIPAQKLRTVLDNHRVKVYIHLTGDETE